MMSRTGHWIAAVAGAGTLFLGIPAASAGEVPINTGDRASVVNGYQAWLAPLLLVPTGWNGNLDACRAGSPSAENQQAVLSAVNYMRTMAGLAPVQLSERLSKRSQDAALIMAANDIITHDLPQSARCWTKDGYLGAKNGNLALGYGWPPGSLATVTGARAVVSYMNDAGPGNGPVGHRRWLLLQKLAEIGSGDTDISNSIYVIGTDQQPSSPAWVAWPTAGYFPRELEPDGRWSLTYPKADFRRAKVTVQTPQGPIPVDQVRIRNGYGDNTISWDMQLPAAYAADTVSDYPVQVQVTGIRVGGRKVTKEWTTTLVKATP
ncbi:MAG: CAP domain-containing protein [Actinomycetales bacterium]|nr:CAP domain-containing protein [Actinomycetales bacterium]